MQSSANTRSDREGEPESGAVRETESAYASEQGIQQVSGWLHIVEHVLSFTCPALLPASYCTPHNSSYSNNQEVPRHTWSGGGGGGWTGGAGGALWGGVGGGGARGGTFVASHKLAALRRCALQAARDLFL